MAVLSVCAEALQDLNISNRGNHSGADFCKLIAVRTPSALKPYTAYLALVLIFNRKITFIFECFLPYEIMARFHVLYFGQVEFEKMLLFSPSCLLL